MRIIRGPVAVATRLSPQLTFDPASCGPNLFLHHGNFVVANLIHKKWNTVRGTVGFTTGGCGGGASECTATALARH
jgi:hypothetical protein